MDVSRRDEVSKKQELFFELWFGQRKRLGKSKLGLKFIIYSKELENESAELPGRIRLFLRWFDAQNNSKLFPVIVWQLSVSQDNWWILGFENP